MSTVIISKHIGRSDIRKEILCDGYFYDVTDFVQNHPGGYIINYYTEKGEDATHSIQQFHNRSIERVRKLMSTFKRRPASDIEIGLDPATLKKNRALTEDFTKLYLDLKREGFFKPSYIHCILRILELIFMGAVGYYLFQQTNYFAYIIGIVLFAIARGRCGWIMHECCHYSFTGHTKFDRRLSEICVGTTTGLSSTFWTRQHNRHHAMPQRLHHDVDLQTMPLLAFNAKAVENSKDGKRFMIRYQAYLFFLIDTMLVLLFWICYSNPRFVWKRKLYLEMVGMIIQWVVAIVFKVGFWPIFFSSYISAMYMLGNFTLNHTFLPVTTRPTHWIEYAFFHTANVEPTRWCSWWMGYLNFQIEHHLFPTMPQFRHPLIMDRVKALAEKHNIPYIVHSYPEAVRKAFMNLKRVSEEVGSYR